MIEGRGRLGLVREALLLLLVSAELRRRNFYATLRSSFVSSAR